MGTIALVKEGQKAVTPWLVASWTRTRPTPDPGPGTTNIRST